MNTCDNIEINILSRTHLFLIFFLKDKEFCSLQFVDVNYVNVVSFAQIDDHLYLNSIIATDD